MHLQKKFISRHNDIKSHTSHFRRGTWRSSHYTELEKKLNEGDI